MKDSTTIAIGAFITAIMACGAMLLGVTPWPAIAVGWGVLIIGGLWLDHKEVSDG